MVLGLLIYIPYQTSGEINVGVWFNSGRGRRETINSAIFSFVLTLILVLATDFVLDFRGWFGSIPLIISTGLFPFLLYVIPAGGYLFYLWKSKKVNKPELLMTMITIIIVSYLVMMVVGIWFRGESMKLIF